MSNDLCKHIFAKIWRYNVTMVTTTARQKILTLLGSRGAASAAQLGRALDMSPAAVRHHLAILQKDGRIVYGSPEPKRGRGRPEKVYRLSDRLLGENFASLSDALLSTWLEKLPASGREAALRSLGEKLGQQAASVDAVLTAAKRMVQLTEKLNSLNYQARWEAGAHGPHVLLAHCPYAAIIERHPELCVMDAAILARIAGAQVEQLAKIDPKPGGATHCVFALHEARPLPEP